MDGKALRGFAKTSRTDALAFLATATSVLAVNALAAVAIGCSIYLARYLLEQWPALTFNDAVERFATEGEPVTAGRMASARYEIANVIELDTRETTASPLR